MAHIITPEPATASGSRGLSFALGTKLFNQPLAMEGRFAAYVKDAIASRAFDDSQAVITASKFAGTLDRQSRYRVTDDGIAIVSVAGMLIDRGAWLGDIGGFATSYEGLCEQCSRIGKDAAIKSVILDIDTPGGMVAGLFDVCDAIVKLRKTKKVYAIAANMAASAGYAIACSADELIVTSQAMTGSIGVVMMHTSYAGAMQNAGIEVTFVHSGAHKIDGNPYQPLSHGARSNWSAESDELYEAFVSHVAAHRPLDADAVRATEARVYTGRKAVEMKLADKVMSFDELLSHVRKSASAPARGKSPKNGGRMSENTPAAGRSDAATALAEAFASILETRERVASPAAAPAPVAAAPAAAKPAAESAGDAVARVFAILDSEEGKKRPVAARKLAQHTDMSAEAAGDFLAALPVEIDDLVDADDDAAAAAGDDDRQAQLASALERQMAKPANAARVKPSREASEADPRPSLADKVSARFGKKKD